MKSFFVTPDRLGPASMFLGRLTGFPSYPLRAYLGDIYLFCLDKDCYLRER